MNQFLWINLKQRFPIYILPDKCNIIKNFIYKYGAVFAKDAFDVGSVKGYETHIKLFEDRYVSKKPYRCSFENKTEIERQVAELLKYSIIQESCSPFSSPVTMQFIKKTGESNVREKTRMCVDFRELNKLMVLKSQPFPLIDDIIVKTT